MYEALSLDQKLARISASLTLPLSQSQLGRLSAYLAVLERWNRKINLTALPLTGFPDQTLDRLIREPLDACSQVQATEGLWYDLGSGGGSPAIPMAIQLAGLRLRMVESRSRKAAFLREAARVAGIDSAEVIAERIETLMATEPAGSATLVSVRAVRIDSGIARTIRHLLGQAGELLLFGSVDRSALASDFTLSSSGASAVVLRPIVPRGT